MLAGEVVEDASVSTGTSPVQMVPAETVSQVSADDDQSIIVDAADQSVEIGTDNQSASIYTDNSGI